MNQIFLKYDLSTALKMIQKKKKNLRLSLKNYKFGKIIVTEVHPWFFWSSEKIMVFDVEKFRWTTLIIGKWYV